MLKRNLWKLVLSFVIVLWAVLSLTPIQDRDVPSYIESKVETKNAEFQALLGEAKARFEADPKKTPSVFVALRDIANERRIDLAKEYFPETKLESTLVNVTKRNKILLDHLLAKSKGRLQLGLDLRGGVAFVLEVDERAAANLRDDEREEKLAKAIEIIGDRINGLGVVEPVVRGIGANRIEVQLPGVNTRDNPEVVTELQKPARLDFRLVYPFARPGPGVETPLGYEIKTYEQDSRTGETFETELFVKSVPEMTGKNVTDAYPVMDEFGGYRIILRFNDDGRREFASATREVAGFSQQLARQSGDPEARAQLAVMLDGRVYSVPGVKEEINSDSAEITGQFSQREAVELANVLNNPLDLPLVVQEQFEVGPSLAKESIASGKLAFIIGLSLTAMFLVLFYSTGGLLAVIAMALNLVIILGTLASIQATLTMPGIAALVLTIGMAVDSNILIFERMREELKLGKSLPAALEAGFDKAFSAILDGNLTTLITAGIMIWLGTGPVKGFGVTLAIGLFATMFSALVISRLFLDLVINGGLAKRIRMFSLLDNTKFDFLKHAKPAFIISWAIVAVGLGVVVYKGDAIYGKDFVGGDQVTLSFENRLEISEINQLASARGVTDLTASYTQDIGSDVELLRIATPFDQAAVVIDALQASHPEAGFKVVGESRVGPTVGAEIRSNAAWAIFWSLLLILVYVAFRFEIGYGVGAVVCTIHDVLLTIGIFVMLGKQFNASMVGAILLIVGYSINDTIIVFDRIREELKLDPTTKLRDIINRSLNVTLSRTLITSGTTLLTAVVLAAVAGGEINDLAVTLVIGVIVGTLSTLFIASPVFFWWHKGDRHHVEKDHDAKPVYDWDVGSKISGAKPVGGAPAASE
jgi:SecD/SecF fusion protein